MKVRVFFFRGIPNNRKGCKIRIATAGIIGRLRPRWCIITEPYKESA
jgi:hypothetical protein